MEPSWSDGWEVQELGGQPLHAQEDRIRGLIAAHLDRGHADFLAAPELREGRPVSWTARSGRELRPIGSGPGAEALRAEGAAKLARIAALADQLEGQGDAGRMAAYALRSAVLTPDGVQALLTDGVHPVLAFWGIAAAGQARPAAPVIASPPAPVPTAPAPPAAAPGRRAVLWPWALPAALAVLVAFLAHGALTPLPPRMVEIVPPAPPAADPTQGLAERIGEIERAIAETDALVPRFAAACVAPPEPEGVQCAPGQVAKKPREIMLVLDASGSMAYSIDTPASLERQLIATRNIFTANRIEAQIRSIPGQQRMAVAKAILRDAIADAPPEVTIGLTSFHDCRRIRGHGKFTGRNRAELIRALDGISPTSRTPLAQAISQAAGAMSGGLSADDPVSMVLISDGLDACGGDPCASARAAKRARPGLRISVIDLSDQRALACVAEATGGVYIRRDGSMDIASLAQMTRDVAGIEGGLCAPGE